MRTCCVVLPLVPLSAGDVIDRRAWPPHVTLVGTMRMPDGGPDAAAAVLRGFARAVAPLRMVVEQEAWFGAAADVLVDLVASPGLHAAHEGLLDALESAVDGLEVDVPAWARAGYRPHRTVTTAPRPRVGDRLTATTVALVELAPGGSRHTAVVLARWDLGGTPTGAPAR